MFGRHRIKKLKDFSKNKFGRHITQIRIQSPQNIIK